MRPLALLALALAAAPAAQEAPLFADDAPLALTLVLDAEAALEDRSDDPPWYPARLIGADTLAVGVRPRGFYRLHYLDCDVPPLRLNVRRREAGGTRFAGQDKLKLVTHCDDGDRDAEQRVLLEELAYRAYALVAEAAFRTRLVRMTYRDARGDAADRTRWAFLIEDDDALAARLGGEVVRREGIHPDATDRHAVAVLSVFQSLIGNTDWTVSTLHNIRLVYRPEAAAEARAPLVAVPYDFDWAGLVDAPYATPDPQLGIRTVRHRRFLGFCRPDAEAAAAVAAVVAQRDAILALFRGSPHLDADVAEDAADYLTDFFDRAAEPDGPAWVFRDCIDG